MQFVSLLQVLVCMTKIVRSDNVPTTISGRPNFSEITDTVNTGTSEKWRKQLWALYLLKQLHFFWSKNVWLKFKESKVVDL